MTRGERLAKLRRWYGELCQRAFSGPPSWLAPSPPIENAAQVSRRLEALEAQYRRLGGDPDDLLCM